ncbi:phospholipase D-like domain-containing protein [Jiangella gansuensis]|uniref:phospholipase D-like domain-containing protein n=1 Tax=Jiangella gansuensis TaxID=281473 RepID=UPI0004B2F601|nr:phospholipase D-like domain-containing protein [Jiangella gansuensis]
MTVLLRRRIARSLALATVAAALIAPAPVLAEDGARAGEHDDGRPCRDAARAPVTTGVVVNNPVAGDGDAIVRRICGMVHQAPNGSLIRIAHFVISGTSGQDFVDALVAAHRRGVNVQVVLDGWQVTNAAVTALRAELGTDRTQRSWLHVCTGLSPEGNTAACIGTKGQHNKFYLFSETGGAADVVVQSSANFTDLNTTTYWNNATTVVGSRELYDAYGSYFDDLAAERRTDDYDRAVTTRVRGGTVTAHFFPIADGDPVVDHLARVSCSTPTTIRIGMSEWDTHRIGIAQRLVELAGSGCRVSIVHGPMDDDVRELLSSAPGVELHALDDGGALPGRIHSKYLLVEGEVDGRPGARWTLTGSPNFNTTSLRRNDEAMLVTDLKPVYARYRANFDAMVTATRD